MPISSKELLSVPNIITVARLPLFVWFVYLAATGEHQFAFLLFVVIWLLDWVDGLVARTFHQETRVGYYLDKVVDRFVMVFGVVALIRYGILPPIALLLMVRDIGYLPATYPFQRLEKNWRGERWLGKTVTMLQGLGFLWLYLAWPYPAVIVGVTALLGALTAIRHLRYVFFGMLFLLIPTSVHAAVVISEVMWDGVEYVELHSDEAASLEGWKLTRQQSGGEEKDIVMFTEADDIGTGKYFLLEKNEEATTVSASRTASTLTLVNTGEVLRLYNQAGNVVDSAGDVGSWPAGQNTETGVAMERAGDGWQSSTGNGGGRSGTPGAVNSSGAPTATTPPEVEETYSTAVIINEFFPNPTGDDVTGEFIELFNPSGTAADLSNWQLDDADGGSAPYKLSAGTFVSAGSYVVFTREETGLALNNNGETVRLLDPVGTVQTSATYTGNAAEGVSYNRTSGGTYEASTTVTSGSANLMTTPSSPTPKITPTSSGSSSTKPSSAPAISGASTTKSTAQTTAITIYRVLPDPVGEDGPGEFIEIKNGGKTAVDISGWQLDDEDGGSKSYTIPAGVIIAAGATMVFSREDTNIALNNTGDAVRLLNGNDEIVDSITYGKVSEGEIVTATTEATATSNEGEERSGKVAGSQTSAPKEDPSDQTSTAEANEAGTPQVLAQLTDGNLGTGEPQLANSTPTRRTGVITGVVLLAGAGVATAATFGHKSHWERLHNFFVRSK